MTITTRKLKFALLIPLILFTLAFDPDAQPCGGPMSAHMGDINNNNNNRHG